MSLALYHLKAVAQPVDPAQFIAADAFPAEAFSRYGFERYLQTQVRTEVLHTVYFLADKSAWNWSIDHFDGAAGHRTVSFLLGTPEICEEELAEVERRYGLDRADAWFSDARSIKNGRMVKDRFAIYSRPVRERGVYYVEAGSHCHGVSEEFCRKYGCPVLVDERSFHELPNYVAADAGGARVPQDWAAGYEPGSSFLWVPPDLARQ